ncbi:MAG: DUF1648 domain-containing protein [Gemmatimonadetes bacterium]|nr:DUF1648 domain-containing protein [Gemmatimonadota bacterium]
MRLVHAANATLLITLLGVSMYVYPELPERIPLHFGADGTPDRWGGRTLLSWMTLPLIGSATVVLTYVIGWMLPERPHWVNMSDRRKLLELPAPLQRHVIGGVANMLFILNLTLLLMFCGMQYGAWESAHTGVGSKAMLAGVIFALAGMPFITIGVIVTTQRRMDAAWREYTTGLADAG